MSDNYDHMAAMFAAMGVGNPPPPPPPVVPVPAAAVPFDSNGTTTRSMSRAAGGRASSPINLISSDDENDMMDVEQDYDSDEYDEPSVVQEWNDNRIWYGIGLANFILNFFCSDAEANPILKIWTNRRNRWLMNRALGKDAPKRSMYIDGEFRRWKLWNAAIEEDDYERAIEVLREQMKVTFRKTGSLNMRKRRAGNEDSD